MPVTLRLQLFDREPCYYYNNGPMKMAAVPELHRALLSFKQALSCVS